MMVISNGSLLALPVRSRFVREQLFLSRTSRRKYQICSSLPYHFQICSPLRKRQLGPTLNWPQGGVTCALFCSDYVIMFLMIILSLSPRTSPVRFCLIGSVGGIGDEKKKKREEKKGYLNK